MSIYNDDELTPPSWIDCEFLEMVLTQYENNGDEVKITNFALSPASMKGDHYGSIMFRCQIEYHFAQNLLEKKKRSLIIKTVPEEENKKRELLMETGIFETEIQMYAETLPKIEKLLAAYGEKTKLAPSLFYHSLKPQKLIIMEDLCETGYSAVRGRCLNEDEMKLVYSKLAKFHAASFVLAHSEDSEAITKYKEGFMSISVPFMKDMMTGGMSNFLHLMESHEEFHIYAEKVKEMFKDLPQACKDLFNAVKLPMGQGDIFVLNHGDFHMKNLMFKFNEMNQMEDLIMVDYQISCYAPCNADLIYSQYVLLSTELRLKRHAFMQYYFSEFLRILKKLGYEGEMPKFSQLQISNLKYRHFSLYLLAVLLPLIIGFLMKSAEELKDVNVSEMMENSESKDHYYAAPVYIEAVRKLLPQLLNEGYLD
ncbi:uncharacterized protein LOC106088261 [Stomoxys calcitrans]|uniref:uncharacterized protein LOC106088261 n=1 Tax=Stomoxys calcitrans TaxID=35570 RepID=UPI0027E35535|nr:uncharacterized protein LOC106088261 [Stomoxys calcitrans]